MNKTSIVILSYNTYNLTKSCIESIRKYTPVREVNSPMETVYYKVS